MITMNKLLLSGKTILVKRVVPILPALLILLCYGVAIAYAANSSPTAMVAPTSDANGAAIISTAQSIGASLITVVQGVFGVAAVVFIIWAGYTFWGAHGDERKIEAAKKMMVGFIVATACIFFADKIVGALMGIFGITIQS
jgi:hypothetical protein